MATILNLLIVSLRPYQLECIKTTIEEFQKGYRRQAVSLPVGSGKTVIFANLIKSLPAPNGISRKALVLAHREELLLQARNQITRFAPELSVAIEQGSSLADPNADVIVASVPTLGRIISGTNRLQKFDPQDFKCIIVDEAHHSVTDTYMRIMEHFGVLDGRHPHILLWGCSATLSRYDEFALGDVYEKVIYHKDIKSMIDEGWLCPFETYQIITHTDLSSVKKRDDFDTAALSLAINTPMRNDLVARTWKSVAFEEHGRKSTIVFALNIAHVNGLCEAFEKIGVPSAAITSLTEPSDREVILTKFRKGEIPVLVNCAVLTEGTDLPVTDCILMTRPTCNPNLYIQMVGRGLRKHPEKSYCLVLDVIDRQKTGERTLVTFPSLLAHKSYDESASSEVSTEEATGSQVKVQAEIVPDNVNIEVRYFNPVSFRPSTTLSWITVSQNQFLLSSKTTNYLLTIKDQSSLICDITEYAMPAGKDFSVIPVVEDQPIQEAFQFFYQFLRDRKQYYEFLSYTPWRRICPPTQMQIKMLARIMSSVPSPDTQAFQMVYRWTVGKASSVISKYLFMTKVLQTHPRSWDDLIEGIKNY